MSSPAVVAITEDDLPLERIYHWEKVRAGRIFLSQPCGGKPRYWTWAQAVGEARRMAAWMKTQDWEPGSRVAILSKNCAWWIMADIATWMAGHVSVPVYPSLRPESVRQILEHSGARACFLGETDEEEAPSHGIPAGVTRIAFPTAGDRGDAEWESLIRDVPPLEESPTRDPGDLATIIYTSGTTGTPKGVMHRFAAFSHVVGPISRLIGLTADDRLFSYLPLAHIVERSGTEMLAFCTGARIAFTEGLETFVNDLHAARPTLFLSVPRLLHKFQQGVFAKIPREKLQMLLGTVVLNRFIKRRILKQLGLDTVRFAACGAAPLAPELLVWYRSLGLELAEGYGMTEILVTHLGRPGNVRPGCVGVALPGVETRFDAGGELLVRSPMNMMGYYKDAQGTSQSFTEDGFFRTGDIACLEDGGQLRIVGRLKDQFKTSKGKYVVPSPIERELAAHPAIEACCLLGASLPSPFAVVVLTPESKQGCAGRDGRAALERSLLDHMREVNGRRDPHERLAFMAVVEGPWTIANSLLTPTLKIRRGALEARYERLVRHWGAQNRLILWEEREAAPAMQD
jgi:long-chain acyl-CoA synthetase